MSGPRAVALGRGRSEAPSRAPVRMEGIPAAPATMPAGAVARGDVPSSVVRCSGPSCRPLNWNLRRRSKRARCGEWPPRGLIGGALTVTPPEHPPVRVLARLRIRQPVSLPANSPPGPRASSSEGRWWAQQAADLVHYSERVNNRLRCSSITFATEIRVNTRLSTQQRCRRYARSE